MSFAHTYMRAHTHTRTRVRPRLGPRPGQPPSWAATPQEDGPTESLHLTSIRDLSTLPRGQEKMGGHGSLWVRNEPLDTQMGRLSRQDGNPGRDVR